MNPNFRSRILRRGLPALLCTLWISAPLWAQTAPLTIVTSSLPAATAGQPYAQGFAVSGGVGPYTWAAAGAIPPGLRVDPGGSIVGTPTTAGTYAFTLTVTDSREISASKSLSITVTGPKLTILTTSPLPAASIGQSYSQTFSASSGVSPYTWSVTSGTLPTGLSLTSSGTLSGTPTVAGAYTFTVRVVDSLSTAASGTFSLTVNAASLTITTISPLFTGSIGITYAQPFAASGGTAPYTWALASGSVPGLSLDASRGVLQGTPTTAGTYPIRVQVTDAAHATASKDFSLVVAPPTLTIIAGQLTAAAVATSYSQVLPVTASGGTPPYTWSISGSIPGLSFDPSTVTLSGSPTTAGTFNFTIQVSDSAGASGSRSLSLTVNPAVLSISTARQLPDGALNQPYSASLAASGGAPPYTWSANGLPEGLSINASTGAISGTPTAAGTFGAAITVSDSTLARVSDRFTLNIKLPSAPAVTISGLPATVSATQQVGLQVTIASAYPAAISGQAIVTFSPDSGPGDKTIQFASGGTTASFTIPAGSTTATSDVPLAIQTGTVSGTINISLRLQAGGVDITPVPAPAVSTQLDRSAPVIKNVQVTRSSSGLSVVVTGYCTAREVTQAVFTFRAASGQTLQTSASSITVDVNSLFGNWFQDAANSEFGTQFIFTQPFSVQGDATAVIPVSVTLTNRIGSASKDISQ